MEEVGSLSHLRHKSLSTSMISQRKLVNVSEMFLPSGNWNGGMKRSLCVYVCGCVHVYLYF